ncbi:MAG: FKBP-type peptidyl-prolyl cis-trans isomerase [bacterium]|nr:FKBP-type peptidyl-prolyl cis-trans isomerase [bacterium]
MLQGTLLTNFTPIVEPITELQKNDLVVGTGVEVMQGATVTAHYTGAFAVNGEIFQSSHDFGNPIPFGLNQVIAGWTEGVPGMKVGGTRRLVIPGDKAYGLAPEGYIPGSSDRPLGALVFDIELVNVEQ